MKLKRRVSTLNGIKKQLSITNDLISALVERQKETEEKISTLLMTLKKTEEKIANQDVVLQKIKELSGKALSGNIVAAATTIHKENEKREKRRILGWEIVAGPLFWVEDKVKIKKGQILLESRKRMSAEEFKTTVMDEPWKLFPEEYEVECGYNKCNEKIPVEWRIDGISVVCKECNNCTVAGIVKDGLRCVLFRPCIHFQNIPIDETPDKCGICGKEAKAEDWSYRFPTKKEKSKEPEDFVMMAYRVLLQKKLREEKRKILGTIMDGPHSWVAEKIQIKDGRIRLRTGKTMTSHEFERELDEEPWLMFPEEYEVQCNGTKCQQKNKINWRVDGLSVYCKKCTCITAIGNPKEGRRWVFFRACYHFQQLPIGESCEKCTFCGKEGKPEEWNKWARIPTKIPWKMVTTREDTVFQNVSVMKEKMEKIEEKISKLEKNTQGNQGTTDAELQKLNCKLEIAKGEMGKAMAEFGKQSKQVEKSLIDSVSSIKRDFQKDQEAVKKLTVFTKEMHAVVKLIGRREEKEEKKRVLGTTLDGNLSWVEERIFISGGRIQLDTGKQMSVEEFKSAIKEEPWTLFPDEYEVECSKNECKVKMPIVWREDGMSVLCTKCKISTSAGIVKEGFRWVYFKSCCHSDKIRIGETLQKCRTCGKANEMQDDKWSRIPTKKTSP